MTPFCGHEELCHRAKFGEDRTTRASCRCENMVFLCFFLPAGLPRSGKLPVLNLFTGQKSGFSPRRSDSLQRFTADVAVPMWVHFAVQNFTSIATGGGNAATKYQKFSLFGKESPCMGDSLDRFRKFLGAFLRLTILHQCFKFAMIRFTGYGVIAEKPRVYQLGLIFPCTL